MQSESETLPFASCVDLPPLRPFPRYRALEYRAKLPPPGGSVTVLPEPGRDSSVAIRVRETGIGIPPDRLETVFDPFVQVDARLTREQSGAGLRLAISRGLARGMDGDLQVESEVGRGSTFVLTLPRG